MEKNKKTTLKKENFNIILYENGSPKKHTIKGGYTFVFNGRKFGIYNAQKQEKPINHHEKNKYIIIELETGLSIAKSLKFLKDFNVEKVFENNHFEKCMNAIADMQKRGSFQQLKNICNNEKLFEKLKYYCK